MKVKIGYVSDPANIDKVKADLAKASIVGIDTETTGLDPLVNRIRLLQIATVDAVWLLDMFKLPTGLVREEILEKLLPDKRVVKIMQNSKFDLKFLQTSFGYGLRETRMLFDTYLAAKLLDGGQYTPCGLDALAYRLLGVSLDKSFQKFDWSKTLYKEPLAYAGLDAAVLLPLYRVLSNALEDNQLLRVAKLEFECAPALGQLELNGILLDKDQWIGISEKHKERSYQTEVHLRQYFGNINLKSTQQVCKALSEITGKTIKSSNKDSLINILEEYEEAPDLFGNVRDYRPAIVALQQYNETKKMLDAFGPSFLNFIHKKTGRIHPEYTQIETNTARNSCRQPNLQQIPRDSDMRAAFIPSEGNSMWGADYSQIELRAMAGFTKDEGYVQAFVRGDDLHAATAASMFHKDIKDVGPEQRQAGKVINFGVPYGMGATRYAKAMGIDSNQANRELRAFYDAHPGLVEWQQTQFRYFKMFNCVRSASGRIRALPSWRYDEYAAEQAAKNFPIQSTAADITKLAMVRCFRELPEDILLVNVVHDELVHEMPTEMIEEYGPEIDRLMVESAQEFIQGVPIVVDGKASPCWSKG